MMLTFCPKCFAAAMAEFPFPLTHQRLCKVHAAAAGEERCESGCPAPVAGYTSDDVPLCAACLEECQSILDWEARAEKNNDEEGWQHEN